MRKANLSTVLVCALTISGAVAMAAPAVAQDGGNNYGGTPPWTFRSDTERAARTNQAVSTELMARGVISGAAGGGFGGGSGFGANSTAVSNYFSVTNNVSCTSGNGNVGSPVTCTGGTNTVSGTNQTTTGSTTSADTTLTGNTITNRTTNNTSTGVGGLINGGPN